MRWIHLSLNTKVPTHAWGVLAWSERDVLRRCVELVPLTNPMGESSHINHRIRGWRARRRASAALCGAIRGSLSADGPNVLEIQVASRVDLACMLLLEPVWDLFSRRIANIIDAIHFDGRGDGVLQRFDRVYCFCEDNGRALESSSGVPVHVRRSCINALDFHWVGDARPIDMIVVGRRHWDVHGSLSAHYNAPENGRLYLDFSTRPQAASTPESEWRLLMSTYARSRVAMCFEPSNIGRFHGRSPLTSRWLQAWAAGCTVVGRRPTGRGVAGSIDWPESTLEIPPDSIEWIPFLEEILNDQEGLDRRRRRNVLEALRRFDTRTRLAEVLADLGLDPTESHRRELERLRATIARYEAVFGMPPMPTAG